MSATLEACDVLSCASADPRSLHINAEELAGGLCAAADEPRRAAATVELLGKDTAGAHARDATRAGCAVRSAMRASIGALEEVARRRHRHQGIFATTRQLASSSGAVNSLSHSQALQSQRRH